MYKSGGTIFTKSKELAERLDNVVEKLVQQFDPEKIILFGSYARGDHKETSTMDFLVIAETDLRFVGRIKKALECCRGGYPPIEPIIYTPQEFDTLYNVEREGFLLDAMAEGIVVYEKESNE